MPGSGQRLRQKMWRTEPGLRRGPGYFQNLLKTLYLLGLLQTVRKLSFCVLGWLDKTVTKLLHKFNVYYRWTGCSNKYIIVSNLLCWPYSFLQYRLSRRCRSKIWSGFRDVLFGVSKKGLFSWCWKRCLPAPGFIHSGRNILAASGSGWEWREFENGNNQVQES